MDNLQELTKLLTSAHLNASVKMTEEGVLEIQNSLRNLLSMMDKTQAGNKTKSYFIENHGLFVLLELFEADEELEYDLNLILLKIINAFCDQENEVSLKYSNSIESRWTTRKSLNGRVSNLYY